MPRLRLLAILMLCCSALPARAETWVAIDNANPPFMYQQDNQPMGLYPLIVQAVFARLGEPLSIQAMPWKRALLRGAAGEVGIAGIYQNAERLQVFDYSAPIFEERLLLYVHRERPLPFRGIEDLHGKRIGVIRSWSYTEEFDQAARTGQIDAQEGSSDEANLRKLASGLWPPGRGDCHRTGRAAPAHTRRPGAAGTTAAATEHQSDLSGVRPSGR